MIIRLPPPRTHGTCSLEETLSGRRSVREFRPDPLTPEQVSQLLWSAQGVTSPEGFRTAPSAGALYPLELYVATKSGLGHYHVAEHALEPRGDADPRPLIRQACLDQSCVTSAPCVFVFTAVVERTRREYGDRAVRYVHMDVGHAAQNLLLQAQALGLAGVPVGAFEDARLHAVLRLPAGEDPVYVVPVGTPV